MGARLRLEFLLKMTAAGGGGGGMATPPLPAHCCGKAPLDPGGGGSFGPGPPPLISASKRDISSSIRARCILKRDLKSLKHYDRCVSTYSESFSKLPYSDVSHFFAPALSLVGSYSWPNLAAFYYDQCECQKWPKARQHTVTNRQKEYAA